MKDLTQDEMLEIINTVQDGVLGLSSDDDPYCIPFGFVYVDGMLGLSMFPSGRKWEIIQKNNKVCFTAFRWNEDHTEWASVVIDGTINPINDLKKIEDIVKANMQKQGLDPSSYLEKRMSMYKKTMDNPSALKIFEIKIKNMGGRKMKYQLK